MTTYMNLPLDILYTIKTFATDTRLDWRTCKKREAALIRSLEFSSVVGHDRLLDWTPYGRLYMDHTLELFPEIAGTKPLRAPDNMDDFRRWYLLQYRWLCGAGQEVNRWT